MDRTCLDCGIRIKGRSDKKFCDDQCRSNYNNRLKSEEDSYLNQVNNILRKNRKIMVKLNPEGKIKVSRTKLLALGFDLNYYTHTYKTQNGNLYYFCYEYGYLSLSEEEFLLVKREEKL